MVNGNTKIIYACSSFSVLLSCYIVIRDGAVYHFYSCEIY